VHTRKFILILKKAVVAAAAMNWWFVKANKNIDLKNMRCGSNEIHRTGILGLSPG